VDVYETNDGYLNIDVVQREPVLRIVNKSQEGFYLDREGYALPLHPEYPAHVLVASGFITDSFLRNPKLKASLPEEGSKPDSLIDRLYMLAMVLSGDTYFRNTFDQIYVNEQKEFELLVFYNKGLNEIGWNKYHVINIKYKNQVICSKL
jgi:cell division protein FtsQ